MSFGARTFFSLVLAVKPLEAGGEHEDSNGHEQTAVECNVLPRSIDLAQVLDGQSFAQGC